MNLNARIRELESKTLDTSKLKFGEAKIQIPEIEETFINNVIASLDPNAKTLTPEQSEMIHKVKQLMLFRAGDIFVSIFDTLFNVEQNEDVSLYIKIKTLRLVQNLMLDVDDFTEGMLEASMTEAYTAMEAMTEPEQVESAEQCKPVQEPKKPVLECMPPPSLPFIDKDSERRIDR